MKVLIVGANGFLGRAVVRKCINQGWNTDCLTRETIGDKYEKVNSVYSLSQINSISKINYDYIFNVAAFIPYGALNNPNPRLIESNIELVLTIHKLFPKSKIIFASSVSIYGSNQMLINEASDIITPSLYGLSKLAGELITHHHDNYSIIRFSSLYGKGMSPNTFIPKIINDAKTKNEITLLGNGKRKQNYLHVDDAANYCMHAAIFGTNEIYLGVDIKSYSNFEVANCISGFYEYCKINYTGQDDSPSHEYSNSHTQNILKYCPEINLHAGLKDIVNE